MHEQEKRKRLLNSKLLLQVAHKQKVKTSNASVVEPSLHVLLRYSVSGHSQLFSFTKREPLMPW